MGFIRQLFRRRNAAKAQSGPPAHTPSERSLTDFLSWGSGVSTRTGDILPNEAGYAQAYTVIVAVNRSVELIVNAVDALDWRIVSIDENGDERVICAKDSAYPGHPLARAFQRHMHDYGRSYLRLMMYANLLYDETYTELIRNKFGVVSDIRWLNPLGVTPQIVGNRINSFMYGWQSEAAVFAPDDIAYSFGFDPFNDLRGQSNVLTALSSVNIDRNLKRFVRGFFTNGALPGAIISPVQEDGITTAWSERDAQEIRQQFQDYVKGVQNAFRTIIPRKPVQVETFEQPDIASNYAITEQVAREVYQAFGIPLELAGGSETRFKFGDDVYNAFMALTIAPRVSWLQTFINTSLLPHFNRLEGDIRFLFDDTVFNAFSEHDERVASNARANVQSTLISLNEARQAQGLPDDPALEGFYMVGGVPVPVAELPNLWRYQFAGQPGITYSDIVDDEPTPPDDTPPSLAAPVDDDTDDTRNVPDKYNHIDFKPTEAMAEAAERGLAWRREYGRGGTEVGVARARDISNRVNLSPDTVRRMKAYFDRHEVDKQAEGFKPGEDGYPSAGRIAWSLWGSDAGYAWARKRVEQMNAADDDDKSAIVVDKSSGIDTHIHGPDCGCSHAEPDEAQVQELAVWRRLALKQGPPHKTWGKEFRANALPDVLVDALRDALAETDGDRDMIADVFRFAEPELARYAVSDLAKNASTYRQRLGSTARALWAGRISEFEFLNAMESLINREYRIAFENGALTMGVGKGELTDEERQIYIDMAREELVYAVELMEWIVENSKANGGKAADVSARAQLWANRYDRVYSAGQLAGARNKKLEWRRNVTLESCRDCIRLDGRVYRASTWLRYGIMPRSPELQCFGVYCGCMFAETDAPISKGRPPALIGPGR